MNLSDQTELIQFLRKFGLKPQKGLGQHFLCSEAVIETILNAVKGVKSILEIGPGPGILTYRLCKVVETVTAIEIDQKVLEALNYSSPSAKVVLGDALQEDWNVFLEQMPRPRYIVSNMPYYITGSLLQKLIGCATDIDGAVLMMQKEVGDRVIASAGQSARGSLSVNLQGLFLIDCLAHVPASAFIPPPKVGSSVLQFMPRPKLFEDEFFHFVRLGFQQPRKTLVNNFQKTIAREELETVLSSLKISSTVRAQQLSESQWYELYRCLNCKIIV